MLQQYRPDLPKAVDQQLSQASQVVKHQGKKLARNHFDQEKGHAYFHIIRANLKAMNMASEACVYCQSNEGSSIDHFKPIAEDPNDTFAWENYFWACSICNSNLKRSQYPKRGLERLLIKPDEDSPTKTLRLVKNGRFFEHKVSLTDTKATIKQLRNDQTIEVFQLNKRQMIINERKNAWLLIDKLCQDYMQTTHPNKRQTIINLLQEPPLFHVLGYMFAIYQKSNLADQILPISAYSAFHNIPQIKWLVEDWPQQVKATFEKLNHCVDRNLIAPRTLSDSIYQLEFQGSPKSHVFRIERAHFINNQGNALNVKDFRNHKLKKYKLDQGTLTLEFHGRSILLQRDLTPL
jgi:uncharacterized protein (TIGR02646 family)